MPPAPPENSSTSRNRLTEAEEEVESGIGQHLVVAGDHIPVQGTESVATQNEEVRPVPALRGDEQKQELVIARKDSSAYASAQKQDDIFSNT